MSDLISRTWLLDVVENIIEWDTELDRNRIIHQVRELTPSVQPERKTGKWLWDRGARTCSVCGQMRYIGKTTVKDHFCPNCGADLRSIEQEDE